MPVIKAGASVLSRLETNLGTLSDKMVAVLERGEKVLSDENLKNFSALLDHTNQIAARGTGVEEKLMSTLDEAEGALKEFRVSFAELSKHYDELAVDLHKDIKPTINKLDKMIASTEKLVKKIFQTVNRGDYNMQKIMQPTMNDIRELSAQVDALTRQLRHSPSDILYKSATPRRGPGE
jgi:phospholipid/cholesterol/gamma-HCH transport system substrate-binding protein